MSRRPAPGAAPLRVARTLVGLRHVDGTVVEAVVPLTNDQPVVYRVAFCLPDEGHREVVLGEGDVLCVGRRSSQIPRNARRDTRSTTTPGGKNRLAS